MAAPRAVFARLLRAPLRAGCGERSAISRAQTRGLLLPTTKLRQELTASRPDLTEGVAAHLNGSPSQQISLQNAGKITSAGSSKPFSHQIAIDINGQSRTFNSVFLRDSCKCPRCVDPDSTQKNFGTADIPLDIRGRCEITSDADGNRIAVIDWEDDIPDWPKGHQTALPFSFLGEAITRNAVVQPSVNIPLQRTLWNNARMTEDVKFIEYDSYMTEDASFYQALRDLYTHGLVFLKNVPDTIATDSSASVANIVERIGSIRHSFYGRTWDVRSIPQAVNVAYTNVYLALHMDLCYMDNTPHLQFLHSMRARAPGGESMFSDSFAAAERMRSEEPELFNALRTFGVTYNYFNAGQAYRQVRPTVVLENQDDPSSAIQWLNWSPPFQGPIAADIGLSDGGKALRTYHAAARRFNELVNDPENVYELRMEEGQCVIFDNRRTLHARRAFESDKGERWLKGAYMDRDAYLSKLTVLGEEIEGAGKKWNHM